MNSHYNPFRFFTSWIIICVLIGSITGLASGFFLFALEWVTFIRENNKWIIWLLPIAGFLIGYTYHKYGNSVAKGNNLILEEIESPKKTIPFKMAPMVLFGTIISHLFGGSIGREGTAVQMGGTIADQISTFFKSTFLNRKTILIIGISAGFSSVFGTPIAGAIFSLELLNFKILKKETIFSTFLVAYIAHYTVKLLPISHTHYPNLSFAEYDLITFFYIIISAVVFGLAAMLFSKSTHFWASLFSKLIKYPPYRPLIGGLIIALVVYLIDTTKFIGLGIPTIVDAFQNPSGNFDFLLKILFTGFTIGAGFKGGEVTPLFFVGATLGSALSFFIPLPIGLMAGIGFVSVFAGATHTPLACTFMGLELFGLNAGVFIGISCFTAYLCSGYSGIYSSQIVRGPKFIIYEKLKLIFRNFS